MKLDSATWSKVAELFDTLVELSPEQRQRFLEETAPPPPVREQLERMLHAHDHPDPLLLDESMDDIVLDMLGGRDQGLQDIPADLAGRRFGNWRARREIGRGGMSVVLAGERADGQFEKQVAIKLLAPGIVGPARQARLQSELRLLARLEHPGVAQLLDGGVSEDGLPYLVMEQVAGQPVTRYAETRGLDLPARIELFRQVAEALAYSHRQLVVHCDTKPANVLVDDEGRVRVVDFGIAALLSGDGQTSTAEEMPWCSPAYAAPEQLAGQPPAVTQDVFGLGALLYELLSGHGIRDMREATTLLMGHERSLPDTVPSPPSSLPNRVGIPPRALRGDLDAICLKALAPNPEDRYTSVDALLADLDRWAGHRPLAAVSGGTAYRLAKWLRRNRLPAVATASVSLALLIGSGVALWQAHEARSAAEMERQASARAEAALADAEQALARSRALREFLLGLFRDAQPDRPREQLPDSEALVALGAERALNEDSAPPGERYEMLMAIAQLYMAESRHDDAEPLLETALEISHQEESLGADELARTLAQLAILHQERGHLGEAERLLNLAEVAVATETVDWETAAAVRTRRAWVLSGLGRYEDALAILEPLNAELDQREGVSPRVRGDIKRDLGSAYRLKGNLEAALDMRRQEAQIYREGFGEESLDYALAQSNMAIIMHSMGDFDGAEAHLRRALELQERIFEGAHIYPAIARANLALMIFHQGRFDEALELTTEAALERAEAIGRDPEEFERLYYQRGTMLASMQRWSEAKPQLRRARSLYLELDGVDPGVVAIIKALLAMANCYDGQTEAGSDWLRAADRMVEGELPGNPHQRNTLLTGRAVCAFKREDMDTALAYLDQALDGAGHVGRFGEDALRKVLRARVLHALGRPEEALSDLEEAEALFEEYGFTEHPHLSRVQAARETLFPDH
ncbi:protein kinase domain-containing protein [Natronospira sp.]|uniref:protein kinase domain-containing protein n=1 Tax=Natronospira sp. TaxID=2024970 RepID=UPI0038737C1B